MRTTKAFIFITVLMATTACQEFDGLSHELEYQACYEEKNWNYDKLKKKMVGTWFHEFTRISWSPDIEDNRELNRTLELREDGIYILWQDTVEITRETWDIQESLSNPPTFTMTSNSIWFEGKWVYLCDDILVLTDAPLDGATEYYRKVD